MKSKYFRQTKIIILSTLCTLVVLSQQVVAAPGNLAQQPLFLGATVQPNIFFAIDDSGSMNWETTLNDGTWNPGGVADSIIVHPPTDQEYRRATCLGYNVLAYNPAAVYTPWKGEDEDGITYSNRTLTTAYTDPYDNDSTIDISNHVYFIWTDADMDGAYDGPGSTMFLAPIGAGEECGDLSSNTTADAVSVNTLPATLNPGDTGYPNSQQNYANWYTYYRKREYVAKRAISELIFDSNHRMGLATLHNNNSVGTSVDDMSDTTKKLDLLDSLGQVNSSGGTPLRRMMNNVGRYFDKAGSDSDHSALGFSTASPILPQVDGGECQQNFNVLFSDGFWNGTAPGFGNDDGDNDTTWDGGSHADTFSDTLADIAMYYYETDLATSLANNVKSIPGVDENTAQHLTTFSVAFGVNGTITADPTDRTTAFTWPNPLDAEDAHRIDDMRHAAWNARGEFLSARDPATLISSLESALAQIDDRIGTATAVTFNSNTLDTGTQVFFTEFNSESWSGDLLAFDVDVSNGDIIIPEAWKSSTTMDSASFNPANRTVYTYNGTDGSLFQWASLTTAQQNDLKTNPDGSLETTTGFPVANARLDYLRGDRTHEATGSAYDFRVRASRLGDIVHSEPFFVGAPDANYPNLDPFGTAGDRYSDFQEAQKNRAPRLYVGANDGMLHGFDASSSGGSEVMAYIPSMLFSSGTSADGLHYLTDPAYIHQYYVDAPVTVLDAYINKSTGGLGSPSWTSVLAGGLRAGGKGVYALDVTSPTFANNATAAQSTVLWEFGENDSSDIGFVYGAPRIVLLNNDEWAVVIGNGFNSTNGTASLLILYLEGGIDGTWSTSDFKVISTGVGNSGNPNGIGQITTVDLNNDGVTDRVYGGDLFGNVWAFDLSSSSATAWDVAYSGQPLYVATPNVPPTPSTTLQPITVEGAVTRTETTTAANQPNVLVLFGTGQYLTTADPADTDQQTFYGVWDAGTSNVGKDDLVEQSLLGTSTTSIRVMSDNTVDYNEATPSSGEFGWYFDLPATGERVIIDPLVRGSQVIFATLIPDTDVCSDGGGDGWIMVLDAENGGEPTGGGIDFNNDGTFDTDGSGNYVAGVKFTSGIPAGLGLLGDFLYVTGTGGSGGSSGGSASNTSKGSLKNISDLLRGRISWQELVE